MLAYLRTDVKKRRKGGTSEMMPSTKEAVMNIFDGVDEYDPAKGRRDAKREHNRGREEENRDRDGQRKGTSYFERDSGRSINF